MTWEETKKTTEHRLLVFNQSYFRKEEEKKTWLIDSAEQHQSPHEWKTSNEVKLWQEPFNPPGDLDEKKKSIARNCFPMNEFLHWHQEPAGFWQVLVKHNTSQDYSYAPLAGIFKNINSCRTYSLCIHMKNIIWNLHYVNQSVPQPLKALGDSLLGQWHWQARHATISTLIFIYWNIKWGLHSCRQVSYFSTC